MILSSAFCLVVACGLKFRIHTVVTADCKGATNKPCQRGGAITLEERSWLKTELLCLFYSSTAVTVVYGGQPRGFIHTIAKSISHWPSRVRRNATQQHMKGKGSGTNSVIHTYVTYVYKNIVTTAGPRTLLEELTLLCRLFLAFKRHTLRNTLQRNPPCQVTNTTLSSCAQSGITLPWNRMLQGRSIYKLCMWLETSKDWIWLCVTIMFLYCRSIPPDAWSPVS